MSLPSSFDEFEQQQRSFDQIDAHRATLAAEAARAAREHPGARLVGLILDGDSREAAEHEWLSDEAVGAMRRLPVLFVAKDGFRWGRVEFRVDETA